MWGPRAARIAEFGKVGPIAKGALGGFLPRRWPDWSTRWRAGWIHSSGAAGCCPEPVLYFSTAWPGKKNYSNQIQCRIVARLVPLQISFRDLQAHAVTKNFMTLYFPWWNLQSAGSQTQNSLGWLGSAWDWGLTKGLMVDLGSGNLMGEKGDNKGDTKIG